MNKRAFEQLYMELLPGLYRLAQSILRNASDAQDAVQQAVFKAWQAMNRMQPGNERAYISRIVINECRNIQRQRMRVMPTENIPESGYIQKEDELAAAISQLSENLRLAILLKYMEGYSEKESAAALGIPVSTFKARLFRARRQLEKLLKEEVEL